MQLTPEEKRRALAAATLTLLGGGLPSAQAEDKTWDIDTAVMVYAESDNRVQAVEPVLKGTLDLGAERYFTAKLVVDTLTGASPNGATPASTPQTFAGPSPYTADPNETPLDDRFRDTRFQGLVDYQFPLSDVDTLGFGVNAGTEYDFVSLGGNLRYARDLFQHNTTLSAGLNFESDNIDPVGGIPIPLAVMRVASDSDDDDGIDDDMNGRRDGSSDSKTVTDVVLGWTQVIDPKSLFQMNYSLSTSSGYQNDPYKVLSVVGMDGEPLRYVYEARPDSRSKNALFMSYKRFVFDRDVTEISYRYMSDDWGIDSHTVDLSYRWYFGAAHYLEPHLRWYSQTAADFYHVALDDGEETLVNEASADTRLAEFDAVTAGIKLGSAVPGRGNWSLRLEYYQQSPKLGGVPTQAADGLSKFDLQPELSAVMLTMGYRFTW